MISISLSHTIVLFKGFVKLSTFFFFFLNDPAPPEFYPLPLHDAFPILGVTAVSVVVGRDGEPPPPIPRLPPPAHGLQPVSGRAAAAGPGLLPVRLEQEIRRQTFLD